MYRLATKHSNRLTSWQASKVDFEYPQQKGVAQQEPEEQDL